MGGLGSGRWGCHAKRNTVEDCLVLNLNTLIKDGLMLRGKHVQGTLTWKNSVTGEPFSSLSYVGDMLYNLGSMQLTYALTETGKNIDYSIPLLTTPLPWGGARWWFRCPLSLDGIHCRKRASKLYLPPNGQYYGCRACYDLTYTSCQESHLYDRVYQMWSIQAGMSIAEVKDTMREDPTAFIRLDN
jgi:hypothetical protein